MSNKKLVYVEEVLALIDRDKAYIGDIGKIHAKSAIRKARIIDAVEVVHGHWIEHPNVEMVDGKPISNYECSECYCWYRTHENYCGVCGAKMDGDNYARTVNFYS